MEMVKKEQTKIGEKIVWCSVFLLLLIGTGSMVASGENTKVIMGVLIIVSMLSIAFVQRRFGYPMSAILLTSFMVLSLFP